MVPSFVAVTPMAPQARAAAANMKMVGNQAAPQHAVPAAPGVANGIGALAGKDANSSESASTDLGHPRRADHRPEPNDSTMQRTEFHANGGSSASFEGSVMSTFGLGAGYEGQMEAAAVPPAPVTAPHAGSKHQEKEGIPRKEGRNRKPRGGRGQGKNNFHEGVQ